MCSNVVLCGTGISRLLLFLFLSSYILYSHVLGKPFHCDSHGISRKCKALVRIQCWYGECEILNNSLYSSVLVARESAEQRVTAAINKLHENDLVHGDLRSSNILLYGTYLFLLYLFSEDGGEKEKKKKEKKKVENKKSISFTKHKGDKKVAIIDFDWSGPPTQNYPFFMNHADDINWPEGAEDGKPLAFQHDREWITRKFV